MKPELKNRLTEYAKTHSWIYKMNTSKGLDSFDNYSGHMDKPDWVVSCGRNRDSEILDESNFQAALERLGGEGKHVAIERFGHWGCGWFELILVNPKSLKHIKVAVEIAKYLEHYPVLDDSDYSERENEYQSDFANGVKKDLAKAISQHFGLKNTTALVDLSYNLNMECQMYYGNDSCIDVYDCRKPDATDIERLKTCMEQLVHVYNYKNSRVFKALAAKIGLELKGD